jgi:hypothetical protein
VAHLDICAGDEEEVNYVLYGLLGGLVWVVVYETAKAFLTRYIYWGRQKRFLRFVRVTLPDAKVVECITVAHTDKQAIENIERRLRESSRTL